MTFNWFAVVVLPWIISCISVSATWLQGNKNKHGWSVALASQFLWAIWIIASESYGFLPLHLSLWVLYFRNHMKWSKP